MWTLILFAALIAFGTRRPDPKTPPPTETDGMMLLGASMGAVGGLMVMGVALVVVLALMAAGPALLLGGVAWLLH